jgi:hypothetical protein
VQGLRRIGAAEWGTKAFHTGKAPEARRGLGAIDPKAIGRRAVA